MPIVIPATHTIAIAAAPLGLATRAGEDTRSGLTSTDAKVRAAAVQDVLARPDVVDPFDYALVVKWLWENGRRRQAAFWFYVFQERSRPWSLADRGGDGAAALRSSLNDEMGTPINRWIASDVAEWRTVAERAISYEKRFPLYRERPPWLTAAQWTVLVAKSRTEYDEQAKAAFADMDPTHVASERRAAGLPVGPLEAPGPPLPDNWR